MVEKELHIAFYLRLLYGGGAERVMVNLMHTLVEQGIKVDLVMNTASGPYLKQLDPRVRIVSLQAPRLLLGLPKLAGYLRREKPTCLISGLHYANEIALWAKQLAFVPTKLIVTEHNTLSIHAQKRSTDRWSPLLAKLFYPLASQIVAVSQGVAKDLAQVTGLPDSRINVIYNPIVTPEILEKSQQPIEHPWFQPGELPVILGVGRLEAQKDFPNLIHAFAQVRKKKPCRLVILGSGRDRLELDELVKKLDLKQDVAFLGFVDNPYAYIAKAAVYVLSSAWEGFGNVLVEAMALGTPVVATDCPHGPAEILAQGKYGFLVPVGDPNAMSEAIFQVLSGNIKQIDKTWLNQFKLENITKQYLELIN